MQTRPLGNTGLTVSAIAFGGIVVTDTTPAQAEHHVGWAVDHGVTYFDVAPSYGNAVKRLGPALAPYRNGISLACKTLKRDAAGAQAELLSSLKALCTDHFDVYQLHGLSDMDEVEQVFAPGGAMETLLWAKREGLVRNIGFSAHSEDAALRALSLYPFDTVLFPMNWALGAIHGFGQRLARQAKAQGTGLIAMKSLAHRQWLESEVHTHPKAWYKPIYRDDKLALAAMKYTLSTGAATLVSPGDFDLFAFMVGHIDACLAHPFTEEDAAFVREQALAIREHLLF
nr:aldo/keto reductase [bacterium]